ncbi:MAG: YhdH/YhfP family quinone oxidoreductase [Lentimicrobium sp.]|jgi:putative YhdH/YhfP family quinone oxidoreductase|nr:YhdH/YhfP family quinone oxidoreductase [Lentimicrobium sp.]
MKTATPATTYRALLVAPDENGQYHMAVKSLPISNLPRHEVIIEVKFSGLNYKDALSASGHKGITRNYPHTPGIDAAGVVTNKTENFNPGDEVIVTGYDLGMNTAGGLAEYICVPEEWVVNKPTGLSLEESMILGTSGFTAASAIAEFMEHGIKPGEDKVLITGATGAVGSMAIAMLARNGYQIIASSGKPEASEWLRQLGAEEVIDRQSVDDTSGRGLLPGRWMAALDTVGGNTLSTVLLSTRERGIVANCGMIASNKLDVPVFPFILRAIRLVGIASAETPRQRRIYLWNLIAEKLKPKNLYTLVTTISLDETPEYLAKMLEGKLQGKILVKI